METSTPSRVTGGAGAYNRLGGGARGCARCHRKFRTRGCGRIHFANRRVGAASCPSWTLRAPEVKQSHNGSDSYRHSDEPGASTSALRPAGAGAGSVRRAGVRSRCGGGRHSCCQPRGLAGVGFRSGRCCAAGRHRPGHAGTRKPARHRRGGRAEVTAERGADILDGARPASSRLPGGGDGAGCSLCGPGRAGSGGDPPRSTGARGRA